MFCLIVTLCFEVLILAGMSGCNNKNHELLMSTTKFQNKLVKSKLFCLNLNDGVCPSDFFPAVLSSSVVEHSRIVQVASVGSILLKELMLIISHNPS